VTFRNGDGREVESELHVTFWNGCVQRELDGVCAASCVEHNPFVEGRADNRVMEYDPQAQALEGQADDIRRPCRSVDTEWAESLVGQKSKLSQFFYTQTILV
jgi:hypothetical protein